ADDREALSANDPATLLAACETVTNAIVADDAAGTVTMTLNQPWGPFIPTIANGWGSVLDQGWAMDHGTWDGDCNTWQNYYAETSESDPLSDIMNGTGPFMLDHLTRGEETVLVRNDNYWREPAQLERVVFKYIDEWGTRFAMAQAGDADIFSVPAANNSQVDALVGEDCVFDVAANEYKPCEVVDDSLPFRRYIGRPSISHTDMFLTFNINPVSNYVGSGQLDGNGIPLDFFSDVHIRKAFAYCFDWDVYISDVFNGEAIQTPVIPLAGMPGYEADFPVYTYDPAKCEEEFKLADVDHDGIPAGEDDNDVWSVGFRLQALYNQGNLTRQTVSEILAGNLAAVNDLFNVETVGLPWPTFLRTLRNAEGPYFVSGWLEDIHDAHNWYQPYVVGTYAGRQAMPDELKSQFQELVNKGVSAPTNEERAAIYHDLNQLFYDQVPTVLLATATSHGFSQRWIQGRVLNPIFSQDYYYTMSKQ
ncbi:MAG TPA: ABC transporter substrate-binding protein, partial [Anaerolineales bacterium]|nr:ABC transporter substrate-binding protein [Anaerolineales bacterium]